MSSNTDWKLDKVQTSVFYHCKFVVLWMCNNDKFDNLSLPILALRPFFYAAHRTEWTLARRRRHRYCYQYSENCINIRVQYKSWFVTLSVSSNVCSFCTSTIFHHVFHLATSSRNACLPSLFVRKESKIELVVWSVNVWSLSF